MQGRLFHDLCTPHVLRDAWRVVAGHYARQKLPPDLQEFESSLERRIDRLAKDLAAQKFLPEPAALIWIPKSNRPEEKRKIALVRPEDRIVLTALQKLLDPLFEPHFPARSYAYRRGRGPLDAVRRVELCLNQSLEYAATADIDNFFDSIERKLLLSFVRRRVWEEPILRLLEIYLQMGSTVRANWVESDCGVSQGSPLSPLLSNIYLLDFDLHLEQSGIEWVRYADNFILLSQDGGMATQGLRGAETFLAESLKLKLNPGRREAASSTEGFTFLGFLFQKGRRKISPGKIESMQAELREHMRRNPASLERMIPELNETLEGWRRYYASGETSEQMRHLEMFLEELLRRWFASWFRLQAPARPVEQARAALITLALPYTRDERARRQWADLLLARCREQPGKSPAQSPVQPRRASDPKVITARQAVEKRRREYLARKFQSEEVVITELGAYLGRTGERLVVRLEGRKLREIPLADIRNISLLHQAGAISGDLMVEAARRNIGIHILGNDGRPAVRIGSPDSPAYDLSRAQLQLASSPAALDLARAFVLGKLGNQRNLLRYFGKYKARPDFQSAAEESLQGIDEIGRMLREKEYGPDLELERQRLFAMEGQAAGHYWRAIRALLAPRAPFEARVRKGARDLVNSCLNYGYGVLYSRLLSVLIRTGLNPNISFLHTPQPGKPSLLFDFIEEFRPVAVDRVVCGLLSRGVRLHVSDSGLPAATRTLLARHVLAKLRAATRYHGARVPLEQAIEMQAQRLARHIEGKEKYAAFVLPW